MYRKIYKYTKYNIYKMYMERLSTKTDCPQFDTVLQPKF